MYTTGVYHYSAEALQTLNALATARQWTLSVLVPTFVLIGVPGNLLIVVAFSNQRFKQFGTACFYYIVMACNDMVVLITYHGMLFITNVLNVNVYTSSVWICRFLRCLWLTARQSTEIAMTTYCVERV
jgi:hypothetical protein